MDYSQILIKPLISEKATALKEVDKVVFFVSTEANKIEVKKAVEEAFKVKVVNVNLIKKQPTIRRKQGRAAGRKPGYKKAYVTLAPGEKIEFFEGV